MSSGSRSPWRVTSSRGSAADFHDREPDVRTERALWWFEVDRPTLVLGSAQPAETIDEDRCSSAGIDVVRRRSGGGSVLMLPDEMLWLDVVVPAGDPHWEDDIGRAMWWVGDAWASALRSLGVADVTVHHGPLRSGAWSRFVCFDGVGGGEVLVDGHKAVGISQRRTRHWARIQTAVHRRWRQDLVTDLIRPPHPDALGPTPAWVLPDHLTAAVVRETVTEAVTAL